MNGHKGTFSLESDLKKDYVEANFSYKIKDDDKKVS